MVILIFKIDKIHQSTCLGQIAMSNSCSVHKRASYRCEIANLERQLCMIDDPNMQVMIGGRMFWYRKKAQQNRASFRFFAVLFLLLQGLIAVLSIFPDGRFFVMVPILGDGTYFGDWHRVY